MKPQPFDFDTRPFIVIWETTQACDLACVHCRAEAQPLALPGELTHEEGVNLIDQVADLKVPVLVFSGGDPLKRKDLIPLIAYAKEKGLRVGTIPAATDLLTKEAVEELKRARLDQMAMSLDFSTPEAHDGFRKTPGAFDKTMQAVQWAHEAELPLQINTVFTQENFDDVDQIIQLVKQLGVVFWEVFFLVPTGRGKDVKSLSAGQCEQIFAKLYQTSNQVDFIIKVTDAPHYRRFFLKKKMQEAGIDPAKLTWDGVTLPEPLRRVLGPRGTIGRAPMAVNAGKGHCFISHDGQVMPSGFLPVSAGNIRQAGLKELYQSEPIFQELRDLKQLKGRCGACEYRFVCGGSRARAFAVTGDYLETEPTCAYVPRGFVLEEAQR